MRIFRRAICGGGSALEVVVIDDVEINVALLRHLVRRLGNVDSAGFTDPAAGLEHCRGHRPDLVVVDLKRRATVTKALLHTVTPWSVYEGWEVTGWPVMTMVRGHIVMEWPDGAPRAAVTKDSPGRYVRRQLAAA